MRKTYLACMVVVLATLLVAGNAWAFLVLGSIGDRVWYDADGMGDQDDPLVEPGINGVTVIVKDASGNVLATQLTSTRLIDGVLRDGAYLFTQLPAGTYTVEVVSSTLPAEYTVQTYDLNGPLDHTATGVDLGLGQQRRDVDFGYNKTGSIGDRVWYDANADTNQSTDLTVEPGINGVTVVLKDATGNVLATDVTSTRLIDGVETDGAYLFEGLLAGSYVVEVATPPVNHEQTYDLDGTATANVTVVPLAAGENRRDADFGYYISTPPPPPPPGGWATFTQGGWGSKPRGNNPGMLLANNFSTLFPGGLTIGYGNTLTFTSAKAIEDFLPSGGPAGVLKESLVNPVKKTSAGVLAGQVVAMTLNVKFSEAGKLGSGLGGLTITSGDYEGYTVDQLLTVAWQVLGGNLSGLEGSISGLNDACTAVNENYNDGADNGFLE